MTYPYWLALLIALDRMAAVLFFNCPDMCVSSMCWVALVYRRWPPYCVDATDVDIATAALAELKLSPLQLRVLTRLGRWLEGINPGHCLLSAHDDTIQATRTFTLMTGLKPDPAPVVA